MLECVCVRGNEKEREPNVCEQSQRVVNKVTFPSMRLKTNFHREEFFFHTDGNNPSSLVIHLRRVKSFQLSSGPQKQTHWHCGTFFAVLPCFARLRIS